MQWPERRHEEWIRTDIRMFQLQQVRFACHDQSLTLQIRHQLLEGVELAGVIETVDSCLVTESLDEAVAKQGVVFGSLERLCMKHPELVRPHLFTRLRPRLRQICRSACGVFVRWSVLVCAARRRHRPAAAHRIDLMSDGGTDTTHTLIVLEEGAEATVLARVQQRFSRCRRRRTSVPSR